MRRVASRQGWRLSSLALLSGLPLTSCREVLGVDHYGLANEKPERAAADAASDAMPATTPAVFFDALEPHTPDCAQCLRDECWVEYEGCWELEGCRGFHECFADTLSAIVCSREWPVRQSEVEQDRSHDCFVERCSELCTAVNVFACTGKAPPPRPAPDQPNSLTLRFEAKMQLVFGGFSSAEGITVRACYLRDRECQSEFPRPDGPPARIEPATFDENGVAELLIEWPERDPRNYDLVGFFGYFEYSGINPKTGQPMAPNLWYQEAPLVRDRSADPFIIDIADPDNAPMLTILEHEPGLGGIAMRQLDCLGSLGRRVVFEVSTLDGTTLPVVYTSDNRIPDRSLTETTAEGIGIAANVPPGMVRVRATREGKLVGETQAFVKADGLTDIILGPLLLR